MKKIKRFLKKVDPVVFALIAVLAVGTVALGQLLTIPEITEPTATAPVVANQTIPEPTEPVFIEEQPALSVPEETFIIPIDTTDPIITTKFFEATYDNADELTKMIDIHVDATTGNVASALSRGTGFACERGTAVTGIAPISGIVDSVVDDATGRQVITLVTADENKVILMDLTDIKVTEGESVIQGQAMGMATNVHVEVIRNGVHVNPERLIGEVFK